MSATLSATATVPTPPVGPANVPPLPAPGNITNQMSQGQAIFSQVSTAGNTLAQGGQVDNSTVSNLLGAGVTLAANRLGGGVGTLMRTLVTIGSATASGFAVGGPFGAAAGAIAGALTSLFSGIFGSNAPTYQGVVFADNPGADALYKYVYQWSQMAGHSGVESLLPQGQTLSDYLSANFPPQTTQRPRFMWWLAAYEGGGATIFLATDPPIPPNNEEAASYTPGGGAWPLDATDDANAGEYLKVVAPLDTSIFWEWAQPGQGATSAETYTEDFGSQGTATMDLLVADTAAGQGRSASDIIASAIRRRPDPLFWASDLYVTQIADQGTTNIGQCETLSAMATVLGLLAVGASTRAIVTELLLQQKLLHDMNLSVVNVDAHGNNVMGYSENYAGGGGGPIAGYPGVGGYMDAENLHTGLADPSMDLGLMPAPPLFRLLVEDYIALAHAEVRNPKATMADVIRARAPYEPGWAPPPSPPPPPPPPPTAAAKASAKAVIHRFLDRYLGG